MTAFTQSLDCTTWSTAGTARFVLQATDIGAAVLPASVQDEPHYLNRWVGAYEEAGWLLPTNDYDDARVNRSLNSI
jgi:hypothetical protein